MTQEEQIFSAADAAYDLNPCEDPLSFESGFQEGVKWADSHPNWHKYPDEKPTKEGRYLTYDTKNNINVMRYNLDTNWYDYTPTIIIAWMELPQLPKFD